MVPHTGHLAKDLLTCKESEKEAGTVSLPPVAVATPEDALPL